MNSLEYVDELLDCANSYVLDRHLEQLKILRKDLEMLETLKKHIIIESRIGMGTERYKDIKMNIIYEDDDNGKVLEWLDNA